MSAKFHSIRKYFDKIKTLFDLVPFFGLIKNHWLLREMVNWALKADPRITSNRKKGWGANVISTAVYYISINSSHFPFQ